MNKSLTEKKVVAVAGLQRKAGYKESQTLAEEARTQEEISSYYL